MKRILHVIPTLSYGGISSVVENWHDVCHGRDYHFDYVAFNEGPLKAKFSADGSAVHVLPTIRKNVLFHVASLIVILMRGNYDAIHVHNSFKNGVVLLLARTIGIKVRVCHSHTSGLEDQSLKRFLSFLKFLAITNSNVRVACGKNAGIFLYGNRPFRIINNTVDLNKVLSVVDSQDEIKEKFLLPKDKLLIGHVGRFSEVKNHKFLIEIAKNIGGNYNFVLTGAGPLKETFIRMIEAEGLSNMFTFIEPTKHIPELLSVFDVFVMPSLFEGVSLALLEAQAASLCCLVSEHVPIENDVGLGLLCFLPITEVNVWVSQIKNCKKLYIAPNGIENAFDSAGYTNNSLLKNIKSVYG